MDEAAATHDVPHLEMIEVMTRCAFELGQALTEVAKGAGDDTKLLLAASAEFRHCFFSVRMGIRLAQAERAGLARAMRPPQDLKPERPEAPDPVEREDLRDERFDPLETEREREGDYEAVSLPQFLKSLRGVAASAEQRRDELPAHIRESTLPTLKALLDRPAPAEPKGAAPGVSVLARPATPPASRSRLLASTVGLSPLKSPGLRSFGSRRDTS